MFSLFYGLYEYLFHKGNYYILILGLDNSGKTTFLEHSKHKINRNSQQTNVDLKRIASTVGLNVGKIATGGVILSFWDLGGQRELQLLWEKYFREAHGIIWVVDSSDRDRLQESAQAFDSVINHELLENLPLLFVINKQDKPNAIKPKEVMDAFKKNLDNLGDRRLLPLPVSALKGSGLTESIDWIAEQVKMSPKPPTE